MGRQASLARLALGRSPFDPPLLDDETGGFVLGPNVQRATANGYVQQFNASGHPHNPSAESARRRLIRAQNDALATVGVVINKARMNRSVWQTLNDDQKRLLLLDENIAGANFGIVETLLQKLSTRWIVTFRRRLLTYKSNVGLSVPHIILAEWHAVGPRAFLLGGLPYAAFASVSESFRDDLLHNEPLSEMLRPPTRTLGQSMVRFAKLQSFQLAWFAFEYPLFAYSVLQSLFLLPTDANGPNVSSIPFLAPSLSHLLGAPDRISLGSLASIGLAVASSPFILAYVRDQVKRFVSNRVYMLVRHVAVKPDRPDRISLHSARENASILNETTIAALSLDSRLSHPKRLDGPSTLREAVRTLFPALFWFWEKVLQIHRTPLTVELSPDIETELLQRSNMYYRNYHRRNRETRIELRQSQHTLRVMAIRSAFGDYNLDPDHAIVAELADDGSFPEASDAASTSTPDPQDLPLVPVTLTEAGWAGFGPADDLNHQDDAPTDSNDAGPRPPDADEPQADVVTDHLPSIVPSIENPDPSSIAEGAFQPTIPLENLLEAVASDDRPSVSTGASAVQLSFPDPPSPTAPSSAPGSPMPGIRRAASLGHRGPRPVRRPTDTNDDMRPSGDDIIYAPYSTASDRGRDETTYRVTILSNHPAETLALCAASITEAAVLLPFDMLFFNSLARAFLTQQVDLDHDATRWLRKTPSAMALLDWRDLDPRAWSHFLGNWAVSIGMQACVHFLIWTASTRYTFVLGRGFGWGKV